MTASPGIRFDAIVLAGGRGSRLGGAAKPLATIDGETLLGRALAAVRRARRVIVVGPDALEPEADARGASLIREDPPFGGPVAAIAAGLDELGVLLGSREGSHRAGPQAAEWVVVLAADLVSPADAVAAVLSAVSATSDDGAVAVDPDGRVQHLLAVYRAASLAAAVGALGRVDGASVRSLTSGLVLRAVPVSAAAARDVDTVDDLAAVGARAPSVLADDGSGDDLGVDAPDLDDLDLDLDLDGLDSDGLDSDERDAGAEFDDDVSAQ